MLTTWYMCSFPYCTKCTYIKTLFQPDPNGGSSNLYSFKFPPLPSYASLYEVNSYYAKIYLLT